eukprot:6198364-Pleurochrysis_carterae.AAC.2
MQPPPPRMRPPLPLPPLPPLLPVPPRPSPPSLPPPLPPPPPLVQPNSFSMAAKGHSEEATGAVRWGVVPDDGHRNDGARSTLAMSMMHARAFSIVRQLRAHIAARAEMDAADRWLPPTP